MEILTRIAAGGLVLLGVIHVIMTERTYQLASAEALWFAGTGIMLVAAGLLTYCASLRGAPGTRVASLIINVAGFTLAIMAVAILHEPQAYLLVGFFLLALIGVSGLIFKTPTQ